MLTIDNSSCWNEKRTFLKKQSRNSISSLEDGIFFLNCMLLFYLTSTLVLDNMCLRTYEREPDTIRISDTCTCTLNLEKMIVVILEISYFCYHVSTNVRDPADTRVLRSKSILVDSHQIKVLE